MEENTVCHVYYNFSDIRSKATNMVIRNALESDGIIFGGAVRDMMIAETYAKRYYASLRSRKERSQTNKYWNIKNHPETAARTLLPRDIDVYFQSRDEADTYIRLLSDICQREKIEVVVEVTADDPSDVERNYGRMLDVQKVSLTLLFGSIPLIRQGFSVVIEIDVVSPCYGIMMQPPFNNLDFLCNGFIRTKHGIMFSRDTGTYIDSLSEIERTEEILKIQRDMLDFKTNFCKFEKIKERDLGTISKNIGAFKRIAKLLSKEAFPWTICNLPLQMAQAAEEDCNTDCCICIEQFALGDNLMYIPTTASDGTAVKSSTSHKACMMQYLTGQQETAQRERHARRQGFTFICPLRHTIDFTRCSCAYKD